MKNQQELFKFLGQLIDIQIKKYVASVTEGTIQDARFNAKLIFDEVNELLGFAEQLLIDMENSSEDTINDLHHFSDLFYQIQFYLEQEHARSYAGWLLDEHNSMAEITKQLTDLKQIGISAQIDCSSASMAVTQIQKQCEFDSAQIAFQVVNFIKEITKNPLMELDATIPPMTQKRLRKYANARYGDKDFAQSIENLYKTYTEFFDSSDLVNANSILSKPETLIYEQQHRSQWEHLLTRYQNVISPVKPTNAEPEEEVIPIESLNERQIFIPPTTPPPAKKAESSSLLRNSLFYGGLTLGAVAVCMLLSYFTKNSRDTFTSLFKLS